MLMFAVAAAPAMLAACSLVCTAGDSHQPHSCHESPATGTASITNGVHACGHSEELPASAQLVPEGGAAPPPAIGVFVQPQSPLTTAAFQLTGFTPSPPDRLALTTQLRI